MEITYEILFEALMLEKNRAELQKLDKDFFKALNAYIRDKKKILEEKKGTLSIFSGAEKEKTSKQLANISKIVKELYERREKKILDMALTRSRTGSAVMDTSALLEEEKGLFNELIELLDKRRTKTFSIIEAQEEVRFEQPRAIVKEEIKEKEENKIEEKTAENEEKSKDTKVVRFIHAVPKFLGKELEVYGPFEEEDITTLPSDIADTLIRKGRAEEIGR